VKSKAHLGLCWIAVMVVMTLSFASAQFLPVATPAVGESRESNLVSSEAANRTRLPSLLPFAVGDNTGTELNNAKRSDGANDHDPAPEPFTVLLFGAGLLVGVGIWRRRQRAAQK
jgi:hypothetical protein